MKCRKCGAQLADNARFCVYCGMEVAKSNGSHVVNQNTGNRSINQNAHSAAAGQQNDWNIQNQGSNQPNNWNMQKPTPNQPNNWNMQNQVPNQPNNWNMQNQVPNQPNNWNMQNQVPNQANNWNMQKPTPNQPNNWNMQNQVPNRPNNWNMQSGINQYNGQMPMAWHSFVVNVQYILYILLSLSLSGLFFSGLIYRMSARGLASYVDSSDLRDLVYGFYPGLRTVDIMMGVIGIGMSAYCLWIRMQMKKMKVNAWKQYILFVIWNTIIPIIYAVATTVIVSNNMGNTSVIDSAIVSIVDMVAMAVYCVLNVIYYKKREHLFIN